MATYSKQNSGELLNLGSDCSKGGKQMEENTYLDCYYQQHPDVIYPDAKERVAIMPCGYKFHVSCYELWKSEDTNNQWCPVHGTDCMEGGRRRSKRSKRHSKRHSKRSKRHSKRSSKRHSKRSKRSTRSKRS